MFQAIPSPHIYVPNQALQFQGLDSQLYHQADDLFTSLHRRASVKQLWYGLRRQEGKLLDLSSINGSCRIKAQFDLGSQSVALDQIVGSASRSQDYDADFRPLRAHLRQRWVKIAALRLMNVTLPNVELIKIGDVYFVIDGHHRISVARSLGQKFIDAQVVVWHLEIRPGSEMLEPRPVEQQYCPSGLSLAKGG
jgi:hypothetical protein